MASQHDGADLQFSFTHPQQSFRLLELPADLLKLVSSDNPPTLTLKAAPTSSSTGTPSTAHAVLCTSDRTYRLRQVHSSNCIFVIRPSSVDSVDTTVSHVHSLESSVSIIATAKATLEVQHTTGSAATQLRQVLPLYDGPEEEDDGFETMASSPVTRESRTKMEHFSGIPLSDEECEAGWVEICGFEDGGRASKPSASALLHSWKAILAAAVSEGIDLGSAFPVDDLWKLMVGEGHPRPLLEAVLVRLSGGEYAQEPGWARVDRAECVPWVGRLVLKTDQRSTELPVQEFITLWKNCLPEAWREAASLTLIKGQYWQPKPSTVRFGQQTSNPLGQASVSSTSGVKGGPANRKWHEKFRNAAKP